VQVKIIYFILREFSEFMMNDLEIKRGKIVPGGLEEK